MGQPAASLPAWAYALVIVLVLLLVAFSFRPQRLKIELLWIVPASLILLTGFALSLQPAPPWPIVALEGAALMVGAAIGWWQGQFIHITVNLQKRELTSHTSPLGMLVLLAVVLLRTGFRFWAVENAGAFHLAVGQVSDALLVLAVGLVTAQRIEMAIRGTRLLNAARTAHLKRRVSPVRSAPSRRR